MALIDRDAAIKAATCWKLMPESELMYALKTGIRSLIEKVPAVDAVEVVFCRYCARCKVYGDGHSFYCMENHIDYYAPAYDADTFFCAEGKRRQNDIMREKKENTDALEEKYRIAVKALQAISTRGTVADRNPHLDEWIEADAKRDMDWAAKSCLERLGEEIFLPGYAKARPCADGKRRTANDQSD